MRLYGKKLIQKSVRDRIRHTRETKDAILWEHVPSQRLCRVKVQGSNDLVTAYYPEGWQTTPFWLKKGAPVRIVHKEGYRGRIELVSLGQTIPVSIAGDSYPEPDTGDDTVLTGCEVIQIPNDPQMAVLIKTGTYQIDGTEYTLGPIKMGSASSDYMCGMGGAMNEIAGIITLSTAPPSGYYRYDLIVVGDDGVIDYVEGTAFIETGTASIPDTPTDHVLLGKILLYPGMTQVLDKDIDQLFTVPAPSILDITLSDDDLAWAELTSTITVKILNQYERAIYEPAYGWYITIEFLSGNGTLNSAEEGDSLVKVGGHTGALYNSYSFTYTRDQDPGDISPVFLATLEISYSLTQQFLITLRDAGGAIMT